MNDLKPDQVNLRKYSKIFTGTNQQNGYDNIFLNFNTDYKELELKKDKSTYFHFPPNASIIPIHETGLTYAGAFAGDIPARSDRIYKKMADYENYAPWGNTNPAEKQTGVWLCAWLSGNMSDPNPSQSIWVDRWYDPGRFDQNSALYVFESDYIKDLPSELTFDPGVLYRYDHIGDNTNIQLMGAITGREVYVDDWCGCMENGLVSIQNFNESSIVEDGSINTKSLLLNGVDQYATVTYNENINNSNNITCNIWVHADDWYNQPSHHIVDNGFRGGWSIGFNNGFFTPFNILLDDQGNIIFNNQNNHFYKNMLLPGDSNPVGIGIDSDLFVWVADNGVYNDHKHLYKINFNGNIEDTSIEFPINTTLKNSLVVDDSIYVTDGNVVSAFDTMGGLLYTKETKGNRLVYYNGGVVSINALDACTYDDFICTVEHDGNAYYSTPPAGKIAFIQNLNCTNIQRTEKNIWVLFDSNKIAKYEYVVDDFKETSSMVMVTSASTGDVSSSHKKKNLFFTNEYDGEKNATFVWVLDPGSGYLYKYDENLKLIKKTNLSYVEYDIKGNAVLGDASGYQWHLNFNYFQLKEQATPQIESILYTKNENGIKKYKNEIPISILERGGWNMITYTMDSMASKLFLNTILHDEKDINPGDEFYYPHMSSITIGCNSGEVNVLGKELKDVDQLYHKGKINEFSIYDGSLNKFDLIHIYLTKSSFNDMVWNFPVSSQDYIEEIKRVFKFKMPGQKSQFYNIHLRGLGIDNIELRLIIENIIKENIMKIAPLHTTLYKIIWE